MRVIGESVALAYSKVRIFRHRGETIPFVLLLSDSYARPPSIRLP